VDKVDQDLLDAAAVDAHVRKIWWDLYAEHKTGALDLGS
jgi:hypothetical protein